MLTVAQACQTLEWMANYDLGGASSALLNYALRWPLFNSIFENRNMEIANFRTLQQGKYTDCSAALFNVRIKKRKAIALKCITKI